MTRTGGPWAWSYAGGCYHSACMRLRLEDEGVRLVDSPSDLTVHEWVEEAAEQMTDGPGLVYVDDGPGLSIVGACGFTCTGCGEYPLVGLS